jgi:hypothetical protein
VVAGSHSGWSAGCQGLDLGDRSTDVASPGPGPGDAPPQAAVAADDAPGVGEDPQPPGGCVYAWPPPCGRRLPLPAQAREREQRAPRSPGSADHGVV